MTRLFSAVRALAVFAAVTGLALSTTAFAADDEHRKTDAARHRQIARAHDDAAQCVQSPGRSADCDAQLKKACKGLAVGEHCGLRTRASDYKESTRRIADHRTMVNAHSNAATCLETSKPHSACAQALAKDCGGIGIGKYCGMRHAH